MRILFPTLQHIESDFYGRVGRHLAERGHEAVHLTYSRRAATNLRRGGADAYCLPDLARGLSRASEPGATAAAIVGRYPIENLAEVYAVDPVCRSRGDDRGCAARVAGEFLAVEALMRRLQPDLVFSEVGAESPREVCRLVAAADGITTVFPLYTIFERPLRLCAETIDAPIVGPDELRPLTRAEESELEEFTARLRARGLPIRDYRAAPVTAARLRLILRHLAVRALWDRDNVYLQPAAWLARDLRQRSGARRARRLYVPVPGDRPFIYFPLQVVEDYKVIKLRPDCFDQEAVVKRLVDALPEGIDLVVKEHPMAVGMDRTGMLRRLAALRGVHLVAPRTSSIELIDRAAGIATVSSTVGFEALLLERPVMTIGRPFYSGFGVTIDVDSPDRIGQGVAELPRFVPDAERIQRLMHAAMRRCQPGAPVLVDSSDLNALRVADSLEAALADQRLARMSDNGLSESARS
jgi:hypothetical protein